jgi:amino acid transporter
MVLMSEIGLTTVTNLTYAIGPSATWLADSKLVVAAATAVLIFALAAVSILGLSVGKWIYNLGGVAVLVLLGALLTANLGPHQRQTLSLAIPPLTLLNLNILGKLAFYALGGFEYVAVFAGECREPERLIAKSVMIATPIIAALFIFGTAQWRLLNRVVGSKCPRHQCAYPRGILHLNSMPSLRPPRHSSVQQLTAVAA